MKHSQIGAFALLLFLITPTELLAKSKHHTIKVVKKSTVSHKRHPVVASNKMIGTASYYGYESGPRTANGDHFNPAKLTAAHRSLPFGTKVKVTNLKNHKSVIVVINDRGPHIAGRLIDLSKGAAKVIGMTGLGKVSLSIV